MYERSKRNKNLRKVILVLAHVKGEPPPDEAMVEYSILISGSNIRIRKYGYYSYQD